MLALLASTVGVKRLGWQVPIVGSSVGGIVSNGVEVRRRGRGEEYEEVHASEEIHFVKRNGLISRGGL